MVIVCSKTKKFVNTSHFIFNSAALFPLGQIPVLEVDGEVIAQSWAINRYLANDLSFYGDSNVDKSIIDQVVETIMEILPPLIPFIYGKMSEEEKVFISY